MKRLFTVVVAGAALLPRSASAQYGYDPNPLMYTNPYGYQPMVPGAGGYCDPAMGGFGYSNPSMTMGFSDDYLAEQIRQGDARMAALLLVTRPARTRPRHHGRLGAVALVKRAEGKGTAI